MIERNLFFTVETVAAGALRMLWPFFNLIGKSVIKRTQIDEEPRVLYEVSKALYAHGRPNEMCQQADGRPAHE